MWNRLSAIAKLAIPSGITYQQYRTTFILKRRWPPGLHKKWQTYSSKLLKPRHFIYDLVEDTNVKKKEELEVILTEYVQGIGNPGDKVKMKQSFVYHNLLLPGFAVYASPENIEKYSHLQGQTEKYEFSSPFVEKTVKYLSENPVTIKMNKDVPWTIEPWHVRTSFRAVGIHVPEKAIHLPEKPISGPDLNLEGKYFEVTVKINNKETAKVKCIINHWTTVPEPLMEEQKDQPLLPID